MSIRVEVRDGLTVQTALRKLNHLVERDFGRPSHKRRLGYYERPGELARKRAKVRSLVSEISGFAKLRVSLTLHIHPHQAIWRRTGPSNSLRR